MISDPLNPQQWLTKNPLRPGESLYAVISSTSDAGPARGLPQTVRGRASDSAVGQHALRRLAARHALFTEPDA